MKRVSAFIALSACIFILLACGHWGYPAIGDLLLDESAFPPGWSVSTNGPQPIARAPLGGTRSVESVELCFYAYGGSASERIRRFESAQGAADEFERQMGHVFRNGEFNIPWTTPEELQYRSPVADRFYCACSIYQGEPWPRCACIAQYGAYFVHFSTHMLPGFMSYVDLERVLRAVDERMVQHLGE